MAVNWKLFQKWQIEEKRKRLQGLTSQEAFKIFEELYYLQEILPQEDLIRIRQRRREELINWRKKMDSLKERLG